MKNTSKGFDSLAPFYDLMLRLSSGKQILRSQTILLEQLPANMKNVLVIGGGTGDFLKHLIQIKTIDRLTYIDISEQMIIKSKKKILGLKTPTTITYIQGDTESIKEEEKYDLIVTNYFLDLFNEKELTLVVNDLYQHLSSRGFWLYTDFHGKSDSKWLTIIFKLILKLLYTFFRLTCSISAKKLEDAPQQLDKLPMKMIHEKYLLKRLLVTKLYIQCE